MLCIKGDLPAPQSLSAASGDKGMITVSYQLETPVTDTTLSLFSRPLPEANEERGSFSVTKTAALKSESITIENCSEGRWYELHAVLSDADLSSSSKVSASIAIKYKAEQ